VGHHVHVGFDVREHAANDVALALELFDPYDRARLERARAGLVLGVIVVDVDRRLGQRSTKACDRLGDRYFFVVARNQNSDPEGLAAHGRPTRCGAEATRREPTAYRLLTMITIAGRYLKARASSTPGATPRPPASSRKWPDRGPCSPHGC